jgi:nucleoside phosphorylase
MKKKRAKQTKAKRTPKLSNALSEPALDAALEQLSATDLQTLFHRLRGRIHFWMGDPTEQSLLSLRDMHPLLSKIIDFGKVLARLSLLEKFDRGTFGVHISSFFPELGTVRDRCLERVHKLPPGVAKAESWLKPIAQEAGANADLEAAIYFASRGQPEIIDPSDLTLSWHTAVCHDIEQGKPVGKIPADVQNRAQAQTISLAEAARILRFRESLPRFFACRDEEEDFIDSTMFRAVEWFGIAGFEAWLDSAIEDLSIGPRYGLDHAAGCWWIFHWCRSDLALSKTSRQGLESWLWAFINGPVERDKPWRMFWADRENPGTRDYIPIMGILPFVWHRIRPGNMKDDVVQAAVSLLLQTQMHSGAWPVYVDSSEASLLSTCMAIHGLSMAKPSGWERLVARAAQWLNGQQEPGGYWDIEGGPTVMLTVLVLDALALAGGGHQVTFRLPQATNAAGTRSTLPTPTDADMPDPEYNCSSAVWHDPPAASTTSLGLRQAQKEVKPKLAVVVATEIELRQALRVLKPRPHRPRIWKVAYRHDTYYLGRFGAFEAVVTLCSMGSEGVSGSTLTIDEAIRQWKSAAVVLVGIAFGASRRKHLPGDVLIAQELAPYEHQKVGEQITFRNPVPPSSAVLVNRFRNALDWRFERPDKSVCRAHVGLMLAGAKLVNNQEFKNELLRQFPNAIGGEMEGAGLWAASDRNRTEWVLAKAVCDWGDGRKHDEYQEMAAAAAVSLCHHVFSDPHALDGV